MPSSGSSWKRRATASTIFTISIGTAPTLLPEDEPAQRAFVKISAFFHKLKESMTLDAAKDCLVFNSGDGVEVDIVEVKARLKSPDSMFTKLGKNVEGEAHDIRDILAITFLLKSREDTLTLFHALQKRGVILQENTVSHSITQTLFDSPDDMLEAVRRLTVSLARSEGSSSGRPSSDCARRRGSFSTISASMQENRFRVGAPKVSVQDQLLAAHPSRRCDQSDSHPRHGGLCGTHHHPHEDAATYAGCRVAHLGRTELASVGMER